MKIRPLYKNLDTSFVNLSALLRYLRQRGFVGLVRVDIDEYRAEISFDESRKVRMREFVNGAGKPSEGSSALQRLLVRARMDGGSIYVYEAVRPMAQEIELDDILDLDQKAALKNKSEAKRDAEREPAAPKIPKPEAKIFSAPLIKPAAKNGHANGHTNGYANGNGNGSPYQVKQELTPESFPAYGHPVEIIEEPAEKPEEKPEEKFTYLSAVEWEELTSATASLLGAVDNVLKADQLGFSDAFNKSRIEISHEYSFLHPEREIFLYGNGGVVLKQEVEPGLLVSGICECLRRILNKLVANPKFFTTYRRITQQIVVLIRRSQPQFDKFGYTQKLEKIIKF